MIFYSCPLSCYLLKSSFMVTSFFLIFNFLRIEFYDFLNFGILNLITRMMDLKCFRIFLTLE